MHRRLQRLEQADQYEGAVALEGRQIGIEVVLVRHGVQDQVEASGDGGHPLWVVGKDHLVGAEPPRFLFLARRAGEQGHLGTERPGELQAHVTEAAQADHRHPAAGTDLPVTQWRVGRDPGAQQRRRRLRIEPLGNAQDEPGRDHDALRVAAEGRQAVVAVAAVVGQGRVFRTILLEALGAGGAVPAGVDHATDADQFADRETAHRVADAGDPADDLVSRHQRVQAVVPFVARLMKVRVADAAVEDVDHQVVGARRAAFEAMGGQRGAGGLGGVAADL